MSRRDSMKLGPAAPVGNAAPQLPEQQETTYGTIAGLLTLQQIKALPRAAWPGTTAAQAMLPIDQVRWVQPDLELWAALEAMDRDGMNQLPVLAGNQILGMLSRENIIGFLRALHQVGA